MTHHRDDGTLPLPSCDVIVRNELKRFAIYGDAVRTDLSGVKMDMAVNVHSEFRPA